MNADMTKIPRLLIALAAMGPGTALADKTFDAGSGATWNCADDANVTINAAGGTYALEGACGDVTVNGSAVTATIESVSSITVNGTKAKLTIGTVDTIQVNGSSNAITWAKGLTGKAPHVKTVGTGNSVKTGAAPAGATTTTTTTTAPTAAGSDAAILDCTKTKTVSITKSKGTYQVAGTCDKVAITGSDNNVSIARVKNVSITGSRNQVAIERADKIAAMGSNNRVTYNGGLSGAKPKTAATGKNNIIAALPQLDPNAMPSTTKTGAIAPIVGTIDCAKSATAAISDDDGQYMVTGACDRILISGNHVRLKVASAKTIAISGNHNSLDVVAADSVMMSGDDNAVRWTKGLSGAKPKLADTGKRNSSVQTK